MKSPLHTLRQAQADKQLRVLICPVACEQEEKKAKEEKDAVIAAAKKRGAEKAKLTKSLIIMDVKPWDDTTGEA